MKRFVGLRVLYIYSFAFDLVELGECTRIRGVQSGLAIKWWDCAMARAYNLRNVHDKVADGKKGYQVNAV